MRRTGGASSRAFLNSVIARERKSTPIFHHFTSFEKIMNSASIADHLKHLDHNISQSLQIFGNLAESNRQISYTLAHPLTDHLQHNKTRPFDSKTESQTKPAAPLFDQETPHNNFSSSPPTVKALTGGYAAASPGEGIRLPTALPCNAGPHNAAASPCAAENVGKVGSFLECRSALLRANGYPTRPEGCHCLKRKRDHW